MAPSDPSGTVLEDCLRVRQSGAIRVLVALVRMIQDLWARACSMWLLGAGGVWNSFVLLPRILGCWGSFARAFLPGRLDFFFPSFFLFFFLFFPLFFLFFPLSFFLFFFLSFSSSQVKFLLSTQIQNSPPLVPGAGSLRRRQNLNHPGAR